LRLISFRLAHMRGYETFWMAKHSFPPEGTELMHLCNITKNIKIGCGFNILPMWHPLRLAEDYAMADILTGPVIFGVGRGYHTREVETFGSPLIDQNANPEMFEEGVEIRSRHSRARRSRTRASTTRSRRRCRIAATP
jgi:alkanesulfonate monooxygenase SsuD/methylene tetrahydromethanopterin reductase-like flavin-dependent oxidoreductase (luciferase family)